MANALETVQKKKKKIKTQDIFKRESKSDIGKAM